MDLGGFNPQDAQQYLEGVSWPADKEQIVQAAESKPHRRCSIRSGTSRAASSPIPRT